MNWGLDRDPIAYHEDEHSNRAFVQRHLRDLKAYIRDTYPRESFDLHLRDILEEPPQLARTIIENFLMSEAEKWRILVRHYHSSESLITLAVGKRGGRKTMTVWDLVHDVMHSMKRPVYAVADPIGIPPWARPCLRASDSPPGSLIVNPELGATAGARTSNTKDQRNVPAELATLRHDDRHFFGDVQNFSITDTSYTTFADIILVKPISFNQDGTERGPLKAKLRFWRELLPRDPTQTLVLGDGLPPLRIERPVPPWYERGYSKGFARYRSEADAVHAARRLRENGFGWPAVLSRMTSRGWQRSEKWWRERVGEAD